MRLKFYAREDQLVFRPGITVSVGAPEQYVGRKFDAARRAYPATKEPYECESDTTGGQRLIELVQRDACLFPANEATAKACGMKRAPKVRWVSQGAWVAEESQVKDEPLPELEPETATVEAAPSGDSNPAAEAPSAKAPTEHAPAKGASAKG